MSYLNDFVYYLSGTEVPEEYTWWSGLSLLGHILGNKVWVEHGQYFKFYPNLYVCLVGTAGSGKNSALYLPKEIMIEHFPDLLLSASIQSREDVAMQMSDDANCCVTWQDKEGYKGTKDAYYTYRPFYILNDELASFLSVDKHKMCEFLVEVFDGKRFSTGFKGDRKENPGRRQWFDNPHVSLIAGAVPTWFMGSLKLDLFSGGLGRRLIIVNAKRVKMIPRPMKPEGAMLALGRALTFLQRARYVYGPLHLSVDATKYWDSWYVKTRNDPPEDPILAQFHETQHVQVLKLAMLLAKAEDIETKLIEAAHLEGAYTLLTELHEPIVRLTSGVGRNDNAGVAQEILMVLEQAGGMMNKRRIIARFYRQVSAQGGIRAVEEILSFLQKSDKVLLLAPPTDPDNVTVWTPGRYRKFKEDGE